MTRWAPLGMAGFSRIPDFFRVMVRTHLLEEHRGHAIFSCFADSALGIVPNGDNHSSGERRCGTGFSNRTGATGTLSIGLRSNSWIDSTLYGLYASFKDWWANYNNFFARFRVTGFQAVRDRDRVRCANAWHGGRRCGPDLRVARHRAHQEPELAHRQRIQRDVPRPLRK